MVGYLVALVPPLRPWQRRHCKPLPVHDAVNVSTPHAHPFTSNHSALHPSTLDGSFQFQLKKICKNKNSSDLLYFFLSEREGRGVALSISSVNDGYTLISTIREVTARSAIWTVLVRLALVVIANTCLGAWTLRDRGLLCSFVSLVCANCDSGDKQESKAIADGLHIYNHTVKKKELRVRSWGS